jgi:hypothetical protein
MSFYLKIEIETFDHYCLEDLNPSDLRRYVSFEAQDLRDLFTIRDQAFEGFKIIRQQDHHQAFDEPNAVKSGPERGPAGWAGLVRALGLSRRLRNGTDGPVLRRDDSQAVSGRRFPTGGVGPFGEDTDRPWRTLGEVAMTWLAYDMRVIGPDFPEG